MKSLFRACILQSRVAARNWCRIDNPFCRVLAMKLRIDNIALDGIIIIFVVIVVVIIIIIIY